jgi:hypothetical protein
MRRAAENLRTHLKLEDDEVDQLTRRRAAGLFAAAPTS